jgi:hypothetical protein
MVGIALMKVRKKKVNEAVQIEEMVDKEWQISLRSLQKWSYNEIFWEDYAEDFHVKVGD